MMVIHLHRDMVAVPDRRGESVIQGMILPCIPTRATKPPVFTEEVEKATGGELKIRLHLAGTLQINASNITQAVGENVVQIGDDLFNSGNIAVAGIPRLQMLVQSYDDFAKADAILKPYIEKAFAQKGATVLVPPSGSRDSGLREGTKVV
jgi:hypothetical protein